ncbi:type VI secretion system-associated FHA domain protein TagH [Vibrio paucivorans]
MNSAQQSISMVVSNVHLLDSGLSPQCVFDKTGGVIGSSATNQWHLKDARGDVKANHCEIVLFDGAFCVRDTSGHTYINSASMPIGKDRLAKLQNKDVLTIGTYQIKVHLGDGAQDLALTEGALEQLFENERIDLLEDGEAPKVTVDNPMAKSSDPLSALDAITAQAVKKDDLLSDDYELHNTEQPEDPTYTEPTQYESKLDFTPQADSEYEMTSSIRLKNILGFGKRKAKKPATEPQTPINQNNQSNVSEGLGMDDKVLDLLEEEVAKSYQGEPLAPAASSLSTGTSNHLLTGPMLTGLGVEVSDSDDMTKLHFLSEEIGESLQSCIKGLLDLHAQVGNGRFGVVNRNLQPIEDNPLRLGLSYEETVRTMYDSEKSLVHLSAPAAISESLENVRNHNDAMQHATSEALNQILQAFSPEVLLKRFNNYKRKTNQVEQSGESWAWNMYCNYYQELTSNRQQGFEKLFWEIFEQSYDKKIRELQAEL